LKMLVNRKLPSWFPVFAAIVIPGSGYVILGRPMRALQMLFFMGFCGFITYRLSGMEISLIGRLAGAFAVWTLSVVEVHRLAKMRSI